MTLTGQMDLISRIEAILAPSAEAMGFELVRIRYGGGVRPVLQIMAERENGEMSVADCAKLSRTVSALLDVEDPISEEYVLEVSSPGIDRPLTRPKDFIRYAGHLAKLEVTPPVQGQRRFRGTLVGLTGAAEDILRLAPETGEAVEIPLAQITRAQLVLTDALIAESLKRKPQADLQEDSEQEDSEGAV
ncbi:MAG: ribosome maturation factor RimP [Alphaproteobacteria bacterium]|nr:ribosome maturation factor RimP [Alphaproteobacteria bacterium]